MKDAGGQISIRKKKLKELENKGIEGYPSRTPRRIDLSQALEKSEGEKIGVSGRMVSRRVMGKASFAHMQDSTGKMQVYVRKDIVGEENLLLFKELDIGDFLWVEGELFTTRTGEKTVMAKEFKLLSKSLRPLPEKWHGLRDKELRYRKRYLDILSNSDSSEILKSRSIVINSIRNSLSSEGFIEVETPVLQDIPGGASARPFKTYHNAFDSDFFMRIAPELYLKRLLVGGWDRVFEIGKNFRNEGISTQHNPEFTMLEVYCAYSDYRYMMDLSKKIILSVSKTLKDKGYEVATDLDRGWKEKNMWALITEHTEVEFSPEDSFEELKEKAEKLQVPPGKDSPEKVLDRVFSKYVQPKLKEPVFITGFLSEYSPLAKTSPDDRRIAERFEIFINGQEVGNAYTEQNNPHMQRKMFEKQLTDNREEGFTGKMDLDYIEALEYGMPPASGLGIGVDRLVMLLSGAESIKEVMLFPMLRPLE